MCNVHEVDIFSWNCKPCSCKIILTFGTEACDYVVDLKFIHIEQYQRLTSRTCACTDMYVHV